MISQSDNNSGNRIHDGFFELLYQADGVYLKVHPPMGSGKKVTVNDVLNKMAKKQLRNFDRAAVELAIMKAKQIPERIAESQEEVKINASMNTIVSPDKMKAYVIIMPPEGGRMLTFDEIMKQINESGITYGIKRDVITTLAINPAYNQQILIAEGTEPVFGVNGKLQFLFDINKDAKPTIMEDGRVNFRELHLIENVTRGQVLVTSIPPTPGQPGKNILGIDIPALDGKPAVLPRGKNVEVSPDGQALLAAFDGLVDFIDGKVSVFSLYEVPADVDNSTGNIYFVGNVVVRGNVLSGFTIEAGGSVEVYGVVEGAIIKAGGSIILRRGMQGLGKGVLISEGDIVARYIEHSNIQARGDIRAEAVMH